MDEPDPPSINKKTDFSDCGTGIIFLTLRTIHPHHSYPMMASNMGERFCDTVDIRD